ncbi:hypothetical protein O9929_08895 [Vibrio lentus]|nr:hypothetical protein [Vibrio lentus]
MATFACSTAKPWLRSRPVLGNRSFFLMVDWRSDFSFLPVGVCWATVKKLGGTPIFWGSHSV